MAMFGKYLYIYFFKYLYPTFLPKELKAAYIPPPKKKDTNKTKIYTHKLIDNKTVTQKQTESWVVLTCMLYVTVRTCKPWIAHASGSIQDL